MENNKGGQWRREGNRIVVERITQLGWHDLIGNIRKAMKDGEVTEVVVDELPWIDIEFVNRIIEIDNYMKSNKIRQGMVNSGKRIGKPRKTKEVALAVKLYRENKHTLKEIEQITGINKSTIYRNLDKI